MQQIARQNTKVTSNLVFSNLFICLCIILVREDTSSDISKKGYKNSSFNFTFLIGKEDYKLSYGFESVNCSFLAELKSWIFDFSNSMWQRILKKSSEVFKKKNSKRDSETTCTANNCSWNSYTECSVSYFLSSWHLDLPTQFHLKIMLSLRFKAHYIFLGR